MSTHDGAARRPRRSAVTAVTIAAVAAGVLASGAAGPASASQKPGPPPKPLLPMLLVTDAASPSAAVVDPGRGTVTGRFPLAAVGSAVAGGTGRYGFVTQGSAGLVSIIDVRSPVPTMLGTGLTGESPSHVVASAGQVAAYFDGTGTAQVRSEGGLSTPSSPARTHVTSAPHHGVAVPLGDVTVVTRPSDDPAEDHPDGVDVRSARDQVLQTFTGCPDLHGEAALGKVVAFGCEDGVLTLTRGKNGRFTATKLAAPADSVPGERASALRSAEGVSHLLGNWGLQALVRIEGTSLTPLPLAGTLRSFDLSSIRGGTAVVLTTDGMLRLVDTRTGTERGQVQVVPAFDTTGTRPAMALGSTSAYVSDPRSGEVRVVRLRDLHVTATIAVGGQPSSVAVID